jgi:hypothetical protein
MRETVIENHLKDHTMVRGWRSYKWVCPSVRGVPDQIVLAAIPPEHRALIARYVRFVETKAPDEKARGQQALRHQELRDLGFAVDVADSKHLADRILRSMG